MGTNSMKKKVMTFIDRNFLIYLSGQSISEIGNCFTQISLVWLVFKITQSPLYMGTVLGVQLAASSISRLFAGVLLDKLNKKVLVVIAEAISGFCSCLIAALYFMNLLNLVNLCIISALVGVSGVFLESSSDIVLPAIVSEQNLVKAISTYTSSLQLIGMIGPAFAGFVLVFTGSPVGILIDGITSIIAAITIIFVKIDKSFLISDSPKTKKDSNIYLFFKSSLTVFKNHKVLLSLLIKFAVINIGLAPIYILFPIYSDEILHMSTEGFGILLSSLSFGLFFGSALSSYIKFKKGKNYKTIVGGFLIISLAFILISFSNTIYLAAISVFCLGFSVSVIKVINSFVWQVTVEPEYKGRVFSIRRFITRTLDPLSVIFFSFLITYIDVKLVFLIIGILVAIVFALSPFDKSLKGLDHDVTVNVK